MIWTEKCAKNETGKMRVRRRDTRIWFFSLGVFAAVFLFTFLVQNFKRVDERVEAASLANFDPGYIISDYTMGNYNSMSETEIQAFLIAKGNCRDTRTYLADYYSNYSYHIKDGHFVCLAEETFGNGVAYGEDAPNGESAAHIIWQAAQDYRINPQVLIVLLQKEQGLITDSWPNNRQFKVATGYGCPDTAPCAEQYFGFKNQIRKAAALFRTVLDGGWTNYPLGENYVQYNPDPDCGGSVVNIRSLATSALYRYTPYQPNAGALAAGYGTAYCGAYGNRNFYLYFEDWFGGITDRVEPIKEAKTEFKRPIDDGWYQIYSKAYNGKVVDIRGGVKPGMKDAETLVFNRNMGATDNQVFYIKYNEETGYYNITNDVSGLYLDVKGGGTANSTPVIMFGKNSSCNQDWLFEKDDNGYVSIVSRCSGMVLDAASSGSLLIYSSHGGDNQKWQLVAVQTEDNLIEEGDYQIVIGENAFDISGGVYEGMVSGYIVSYMKKNQDNQKFKVIFDENRKIYKIQNIFTKLYLTAGSKLSVQKENNLCSQDWVFERDNDKYKMYSACNKLRVTVLEEKVGSCYAIGTDVSDQVLIGLDRLEDSTMDDEIGADVDNAVLYEDRDYQIKMENEEKTIDISGGVTSNMQFANLVTFAARRVNNNNQLFRFKYDEEKGAYYIYNPISKLNLDVARSGTEDGSRVIGFGFNGGYCNQLWLVEKVEGGYTIKSSCSGKLLSSSDIKIGTSTSLAIYGDGHDGQIWKIVEP